MDINQATVLLTGGANGLGKCILEDLTERGATVIVMDKDVQALKEISSFKAVHTYPVDLLNQKVLDRVMEEVLNRFKINVLINNAGILHNRPLVSFGQGGFVSLSNEEWDLVLGINARVPFILSRAISEHMIKNRIKGVIINISSISAQGNVGQSAYSAAKAAIEAFTKAISKELGAFGIRAACVAPGYMDTPSTRAVMSDEYFKGIIKKVPLKRLGSGTEMARGVRFIIENDFFNGKALSIDGGLTI